MSVKNDEFNASDEKAVEAAITKDAKDREQQLADLRSLMKTKSGRRLAFRILELTGVNRSSFTGNSTTFFNEGQRNIGLWLTDELLNADTDAYLLMIKEHRG